MAKTTHFLFFVAALFVQSLVAAQPSDTTGDDLAVTVKKVSGVVVVDVSMSVKAGQRIVWDVLTDYDHMAQFFPNLQSSKIIERNGNRFRVAQKGKVSYGPFSFAFDSVRDIELRPYDDIRSTAVSGSLKKGDARTRLIAENAETRVIYHSESIPNAWVPPGIGPSVIASQTRDQFESLRKEIMVRQSKVKPSQ